MNGIWTAKDAEHHQVSELLAEFIYNRMRWIKATTFCDFGCGNGYYVDYLLKKGFHGVGIDGNKAGIKYKTNVFVEDLTFPIQLKHDVSISLEVAEHLPKSAQETFMRNVCDSAQNSLILSWAEIGQPGIGHVNCRSQEDVIADVESRGFKLNKIDTDIARYNVDYNTDWFRRTLLIFDRV